MPKQSAGLLPYRWERSHVELFLVHPGGPFWSKKDEGAWSIPKGEFAESEEPLEAAKREFREETGFSATGGFQPLHPVRQSGGKTVYAWAFEAADLDATRIESNSFSMEWPKGSGKTREFPEIDRAGWFPFDVARRKLLKSQLPFIDQLRQMLLTDDPPKNRP